MYTAGSLFSGIGGIDLAFANEGFDIRWQVEIEPFCQQVLKKHAPEYWPNAKVYEDVKRVGSANLEPVDVIFGGFPCQDISNAGRGEGIKEGTRSGLWIEFARIIGELRPRLVLLENVAAITTRDGARVAADLTALGYDAEWGIVPASAVGAPHERKRWWCMAYSVQPRLAPERSKEPHKVSGSDPVSASGDVAYANESGRRQEFAGNQDGITSISKSLAYSDEQGCVEGWTGSTLRERAASAIGAGTLAHDHGSRQLQPSGFIEECGYGTEHGNQELVNANGQRLEEQCGDFAAKSPESSAERSGGVPNSNSQPTIWSAIEREERSRGAVESRLGRAVLDGLPGWMDRSKYNRWAAGPGEAQFWYEPPRTAKGIRNRVSRLKALGNAVCVPLVRVFAATIREALEKGVGL